MERRSIDKYKLLCYSFPVTQLVANDQEEALPPIEVSVLLAQVEEERRAAGAVLDEVLAKVGGGGMDEVMPSRRSI